MATFQGLPNNDNKPSSRVLKPPGGGHSDIFGAPETKLSHARPKYDQQNSSNISGALGTADANEIAEATAREVEAKQHVDSGAPAQPQQAPATNGAGDSKASQPDQANNARGRVPPGGFSQGFW